MSTGRIQSETELYSFLLETYSQSSKENLPERLCPTSEPDAYEALKQNSQSELARIHCRQLAFANVTDASEVQ